MEWQLCVRLKYGSSVHNIPFSREQLSRLDQEKHMHRSVTVCEDSPNRFQFNMLVDFDAWKQKGMDFSPEDELLWIMVWFIGLKQKFKVNSLSWFCFLQTPSFSFHSMLIDGLESCGLLVEYCDIYFFTLILTAPIHCRRSCGEQEM